MTTMLYWFLYFVITGALSIGLHEAGHLRIMKKHGRKAKLHWEKGCIVCGTHADYATMTRKQLYEVYSIGVWAGMIPIIISSVAIHPVYILMTLPYIGWSWHDLKNMKRCRTK